MIYEAVDVVTEQAAWLMSVAASKVSMACDADFVVVWDEKRQVNHRVRVRAARPAFATADYGDVAELNSLANNLLFLVDSDASSKLSFCDFCGLLDGSIKLDI